MRKLSRYFIAKAAGTAFAIALLAVAAAAGPVTAVASAATPASGARLVASAPMGGAPYAYEVEVYSLSMERDIPLKVIVPPDESVASPVLYLLNGAGGGEDSANWTEQGDVDTFFLDKQAYVVIPQQGAFSYYTDWQRPDPAFGERQGNNGINEWQTFLTEELPPVVDSMYNTNGKNGLAGLSMSGSAVLDLAIQSPELYSAIGSFSGCAATSGPVGSGIVQFVTALGGADATDMWGPVGGPDWAEHDAYLNATRLPHIPMYISSGNGLPGVHETLENPQYGGYALALGAHMATTAPIEAVTAVCTNLLKQRTDALGMDNIHYELRDAGVHSWGYWKDDLHNSWPMFERALDVPGR